VSARAFVIQHSAFVIAQLCPLISDLWPLMLPLLTDLRSQALPLKRFVSKAMLLLVLFLALDRVAGSILLRGLERYYGMDVPAQVLCVGHSHTVLGIDQVA